MDKLGKGTPFVFAGAMVLFTLLLTFSLESYAPAVKNETATASD